MFGNPERYSYEHAKKWLQEHHCYGSYDSLKKEDYTIVMSDKYVIHARFIPSEEKSQKFIILAHGVTANQIYDAKYVDTFHNLGYNIITFDERRHGMNKKVVCTMGKKEGKDLYEISLDTYKRYGRDIFLGVHGESMGASVTLLSLQYQPDFKFVIVDCPYSSLKDLTISQIKARHLPSFFAYTAGIIGKIFYGYNPLKVIPKEAITKYHCPLLIMDGDNDNLIPPIESKEVYDSYNGEKELHYFKGADHAFSIITDPLGYNNIVKDFLNKVEKSELK